MVLDEEQILVTGEEEEDEEEEAAETGESASAAEPAMLNGMETKLGLARRMIQRMRRELDQLENMLDADGSGEETDWAEASALSAEGGDFSESMRTLEGVFDGQHMVGEDGRPYLVPQNYASKSKLVEGDLLRLTISSNGRFIFKQRGPIDRQRIVGMLVQDEQTADWRVMAGGQKYCVLPASISFYKGEAGDECVVLVPRNAPSRWAAVENVIKREE